jgi:hypothetical protein
MTDAERQRLHRRVFKNEPVPLVEPMEHSVICRIKTRLVAEIDRRQPPGLLGLLLASLYQGHKLAL